jgi:hypothetical protein
MDAEEITRAYNQGITKEEAMMINVGSRRGIAAHRKLRAAFEEES